MLSQPPTLTLPAEILLAQGMILVSIYKPVLLLILFGGWAWVISAVYDKHAARFFLPRRRWNTIHLIVGLVALLGGLMVGAAIPNSEGAFWAAFGVVLVLLLGDLVAYPLVANRDERVPEEHKIRLRLDSFRQARAEKKAVAQQATVALLIKSADDKGRFTRTLAPPMAESPEYEVRTAAEKIYIAAVLARAAQIDIGPVGKDNLYGASFMVDGVRTPGETMPAANAAKIMDFWKSAAGMDVADRRRKQVGSLSVEQGIEKHILKLTSIGAQGGMRLTMLLDPEKAVSRTADKLGLLDSQLNELKSIVAEGKGVVLLGAPLDSGRTTTLYAVLKMHDAYTSNVQTVEVEPQATLEGIRSNKWEPGADGVGGAEFSTTVRSILRRDPDVLGVAELPDANTAKEIAKADHERIRTYASLKAGDALSAIQTYVKAVGDGRQAGGSLHGVVCQRLVRKLCTNCRVGYPPSGDMLKKLGIPEGRVQQLFKRGGQVLIKNRPETCPVCGGSGYFGQEGVFEVFSITPEERELITTGNFNGLKAALRKRQAPTIQQVAIRKAVDGITSVEEVMRVTSSERPPEGGGTAPAPASGGSGPAPVAV